MVASQNNTYAPAIRFDADNRNADATIYALNIPVKFKLAPGTFVAV